ncbi:MAG: hypothetical protein WC297_02645 [Candidatus Paceibacterota bacterium]|jgi:hypothetical protein
MVILREGFDQQGNLFNGLKMTVSPALLEKICSEVEEIIGKDFLRMTTKKDLERKIREFYEQNRNEVEDFGGINFVIKKRFGLKPVILEINPLESMAEIVVQLHFPLQGRQRGLESFLRKAFCPYGLDKLVADGGLKIHLYLKGESFPINKSLDVKGCRSFICKSEDVQST